MKVLVVFSSDQGPARIRDPEDEKKERPLSPRKEARQTKKPDPQAVDAESLRLNAMGYAGPFRGGKHGQYEGGVRIPFVVRWPGHVQAGRVDDESVISGADWLPTLCSLTATTIVATDFDGEDVSQALLGETHTRTKPLLWKTSSPQSTATIRDGRWKLHFPNSRRSELQLYDVPSDPGEEHNLANDQSEIVRQLAAKIEHWQASLPKEYDKGEDRDADR